MIKAYLFSIVLKESIKDVVAEEEGPLTFYVLKLYQLITIIVQSVGILSRCFVPITQEPPTSIITLQCFTMISLYQHIRKCYVQNIFLISMNNNSITQS